MTEVVNEAGDLCPAHAVHGFTSCTWRQRPLVGIQAGVGKQVQVRVVQQGVDPLERQSSLAAISNDAQQRFSVLHLAYLAFWSHLNHLPPFALHVAFPRSTAGRYTGDYYGGSVALALAGCRRSRGTSSSHVRGRCRCPTHPLAWPHWPMSIPAKVHRLHGSRQCTGWRRLSARFFRRVRTFTTGDWDSSNQAFTMSAGSNTTCSTASSRSCALLPACSCPVDLSIAGKLVAQTPPSSVSRLHRGYDDAPHGAHRTCELAPHPALHVFMSVGFITALVIVTTARVSLLPDSGSA